jgi:hypothetical protein
MKKLIAVLSVVLTLAGCFPAAYVPEEHTQYPEKSSTPAPTVQVGEGIVGPYAVKVIEAKKAKTYDGKSAVVIEFDWTNNSNESKSFMWATAITVFQNGVECGTAIIGDDEYDDAAYMREIKPGKSHKVWQAWEIYDDSPLELEIKPAFSFSDDCIYATLELK